MKKKVLFVVMAAGVFGAGLLVSAQTTADSVKADYDRANSVASRTGAKVYHQADAPNWIAGETRFWYRTSV